MAPACAAEYDDAPQGTGDIGRVYRHPIPKDRLRNSSDGFGWKHAMQDLTKPHVRPRGELKALVYQQILDRIVSGELKTGERLPPEPVLARQMQVSRSTVRNALSTLRDERFIVSIRGSGNYVGNYADGQLGGLLASSDPETMADNFELRIALECELAFWAAHRRTEAEIDAFQRNLDQQEQHVSVDDQDFLQFRKFDVGFHRLISESAKNVSLLSNLDAISATITRGWTLWRELATKPLEQEKADLNEMIHCVFREHQAIFACIRSGDCESARSAMRYHLSNIQKRFRRVGFFD